MPTEFSMTPGAWGHVRFAPSWLWETMLAIRTLTVRHHQPVHRPWLDQVDRTAVGAAAPALVALIPRRGWSPDFLTPASATGATTLDAQLDAVSATPVAVVAHEMRRSLASSPSRGRTVILQSLLDDPVRAREVLVREVRAAFDLLLAPWVDRIGRLLEAEVRRRGETAALHGMIAAVDGVHPTVTARARGVRSDDTDDVIVRCRELVLMPSVFAWPYPVAIVEAATPALAYPAPGVGTVWEDGPTAPAELAGVLGRGRADVLASLTEPTTTTALAARLRVAASTASEHLTALRSAGLVTAERRGRAVLYRRADLGSALVARPDGPRRA